MPGKMKKTNNTGIQPGFLPVDALNNISRRPGPGQPPVSGRTQRQVDVLDILDALPFYAMLIDENHYILEVNKAVHTVLGIKREDILGKYCPLVIHGLKTPFPGCPLEESVEKNKAVERELYDRNTGRWVVSAVYPTGAFTRDGRRIYFHMVTDVTERKQANEQLETSREQLRWLSARCQSVREEEKRKIARDLHDETSQVLASLHAHLEAAIGTLPRGATRTEELLRKAQTLSTNMLDDIHKMIYELRPSELDELGLVAAVNSMINNYLKVTNMKISCRTSGNVRRLPDQLEAVLFRVVQEAFNNIVRHAQAKKVTLHIWFKKQSVKIRIKDNGSGFNPQKILNANGRPPGLGLVGMKERIEGVKGSLVINSSPGLGTEIMVEVPILESAIDE
jgi:PAS domain S-box-containing protein